MEKEIPVWEKLTLSIADAAAYSGIGEKKLREIVRQPECNFALRIGQRTAIKRKLFERFLEESETI